MYAATPVEEHRRLEEDPPSPGKREITPKEPPCGDRMTTPGYNKVATNMAVCQPMATDNWRDNPGLDHVTEISAFVETADVILGHLEMTRMYDKESAVVTNDMEKDISTGLDKRDECNVATQPPSSDNIMKQLLEEDMKKTFSASLDENMENMMIDQRMLHVDDQ